MKSVATLSISALILTGCATLPPVDYQYPPAIGTFTVSLTESFDCNKSGTSMFVVNGTPTVNVSYAANQTAPLMTVEISKTKSAFADSDVNFSFYNDGRLKSLNGSSTGQGAAILKQVISTAVAAAALVGAGGPPPKPGLAPVKKTPECETIDDFGKGKPVTITYSSPALPMPLLASPTTLNPDASNVTDALAKTGKLPVIQVDLVVAPGNIEPAISKIPSSDAKDYVYLPLQPVRNGTLRVVVGNTAIYEAAVLVPIKPGPDKDAPYLLPISKARLMGKSQIVLAITEAGSVNSIEYARTTGAADVPTILTSALTAATPESAADKAADKKGQVDEIIYNQKLVHCKAQPEDCTD